jgi:AcrR family transcriptional regulator
MKTKDKIIQVAGKLASEIGLNSITIGKVAEISNENKGTIHYHFKGKQHLLEAVLSEIVDKWDMKPLQSTLAKLRENSDSSRVKLEAIEKAVGWLIDELFTPKKPVWHRRVLFQGADSKEELSKIIVDNVFEYQGRLFTELFQIIKPSLSEEEAFMISISVISPIFTHAEKGPILAKLISKNDFDLDYIDKLKSLLIKYLFDYFGLSKS